MLTGLGFSIFGMLLRQQRMLALYTLPSIIAGKHVTVHSIAPLLPELYFQSLQQAILRMPYARGLLRFARICRR